MGRAYLVLWSKDRLKQAAQAGWVGKPLPALYGGPHVSHPSLLRHKVASGDVVYPVSVFDGRLWIVCRATVGEMIPVEEFVRRQVEGILPRVPTGALSWLQPTCTTDAAVLADSTPLRVDCAVPAEVLGSVRLVNPKGQERPLKHVKDGRLTHTAGLDSHYYRLADATAGILAELVRSVAP